MVSKVIFRSEETTDSENFPPKSPFQADNLDPGRSSCCQMSLCKWRGACWIASLSVPRLEDRKGVAEERNAVQ